MHLLRLIPLANGAAALVGGLWAGLVRIGLALPGRALPLVEFHSALMVSGFLGTLISLERAVAIGRPWAYSAPFISALGALLLFAGRPDLAAAAFLLASLCLIVNSAVIVARQPALFTVMLVVAAGLWGGGTLMWMTRHSMADVAGWWLGFLVLTIAAERLELSRLLAPTRFSQAMLAIAATVFLMGVVRQEFAGESALFSGLGLLAITAWLWKHDVALQTIRRTGQTRFSAACMLAGYVWLGISALILLLVPPGTTAFSYDAAVHAMTIGFVLSMIFGHAPIILPAVARLRIGYSASAYIPLALLHASVAWRITADLLEWVELRSSSGLVTIIALAGYAGTLLVASRGDRTTTHPKS